MNQPFGDARYWTEYVEDRSDGYAGLRLHRERFGRAAVAAQVLYWDAAGQFTVETFDGDVPAEIIEAVIAVAKEKVRVR